jgi:hypothetical protein
MRALRAILVAGVATLAFPAASMAADTTVAVDGTTEPTLSTPTFGLFADVVLDGTRKPTTASISDWSVVDARGTGAGWNVNMVATVPTDGGALPDASDDKTLATATIVPAASATITNPDPLNASAAPTSASPNIRATNGATVMTAGTNAGMGTWNFTQGANDLTLTVPSDARKGTYTVAITTTFGPQI